MADEKEEMKYRPERRDEHQHRHDVMIGLVSLHPDGTRSIFPFRDNNLICGVEGVTNHPHGVRGDIRVVT